MRHGKIKNLLLWYYLADELKPRQKKLVEDHLSKCQECQKELKLLKKLDFELEHLEDKELSSDFIEKLQKRLAKIPTKLGEPKRVLPTLRLPSIPQPVTALIVLMLLLITGISFIHLQRRTPREFLRQQERYQEYKTKLEAIKEEQRIILSTHDISESLKKVTDIVNNLGGEITILGEKEFQALGLEKVRKLKIERLVSLHIPTSNYSHFLAQIEKIGDVKIPPTMEVPISPKVKATRTFQLELVPK